MYIDLLHVTKSTTFDIHYSYGSTNINRLYNNRGSFGDVSILSWSFGSNTILTTYLMSQGDTSNSPKQPHVLSNIWGSFGSTPTHHLYAFYNPQIPIMNSGVWFYSSNVPTFEYSINLFFTKYAKSLMKVVNTMNSSNTFNITYTPNIFDVLDIVTSPTLIIASAYAPSYPNSWSNYGSGTSPHYRLVPSSNGVYQPYVYNFASGANEVCIGIQYPIIYNTHNINHNFTLNGYPLPPPTNSTRVILMTYPLFPYAPYQTIVKVRNLPLTLKWVIVEPCTISLNGVNVKVNSTTNTYEIYTLDVDPKDEVAWVGNTSSRPFSCFLSGIYVRS